MEQSIILTLLSIAVFLSGYYIFTKKTGMTHSISAMYDELDKIDWKWSLAFILWQWAFSILMLAGNPHFLMFFAAGAICISAAAAPMEGELETKVHVRGATGGIIAGMAWVYAMGFWPLMVLQALYTVYAKYKPVKNHTRYIEKYAFLIVGLTAILNYLI